MGFILVFFGARMKRDNQDDSSFSSWYPIKPGFHYEFFWFVEAGLRPTQPSRPSVPWGSGAKAEKPTKTYHKLGKTKKIDRTYKECIRKNRFQPNYLLRAISPPWS